MQKQELYNKIRTRINELVPRIEETKDVDLVERRFYTSYLGESGDEEFSNELDGYQIGFVLNGIIYGFDELIPILEFKDNILEFGKDENGQIDVWEYERYEILPRPIHLEHILEAIRRQDFTYIMFSSNDKQKVIFDRLLYSEDKSIRCIYNLSLSLENQSLETLEALDKILN